MNKIIVVLAGITVVVFALVLSLEGGDKKAETPPVAKETSGVVKITDPTQRDAAIAKVEAVFDADYAKRWGYLLEPTDVYQNPKGSGLIVWMGETIVYLIDGDSVYVVTKDATVLLPEGHEIPDAPHLTFADLAAIKQARSVDYERLYDACLAKFKQKDIAVPRGGSLDQQLEKELQKCKEQYKSR